MVIRRAVSVRALLFSPVCKKERNHRFKMFSIFYFLDMSNLVIFIKVIFV